MSKKEKEMIKVDDTATPSVIVKTKKRGGCGTFLLGFVFAFVLMLVVVVGTGIYMYYNVSIKTVENMIGVTIPVEGDIKNLALKDLLAKKDKLVNGSLETLNTEFGLELPETIPGTKISIKETYDETIKFLNEEKKVKEYRVQDIVNNLSAFVEAVLPKLYDHVTVGQLTDTAQTTLLTDLGYPATKDKFYNVGTETEPDMKTLSELTINQALDIVPEYFSSDNMTVQMALDAIGAEWLPKPEEGKTDIYAELRDLKITDLNVETITGKIKGEVLLKMVDLSDYDFLQTDEFKGTYLNKIGDYMKTIELGEFVKIDTVLTDSAKTTFYEKTQYKNLADSVENVKAMKLSKVREAILNMPLDKIFTAEEIVKISTVYQSTDKTLSEFFADNSSKIPAGATFKQATTSSYGTTVIDWTKYDGYVTILGDSTASDYETNINEANLQELLGGGEQITPIASVCDLTIGEILDSDNAINTILAEVGTLGELTGASSDDNGFLGVLADIELKDLMNNPTETINNALTGSTKTLKNLLNAGDSGNEIIDTVMSVEVGALFKDASNAILDKINPMTLGTIMGINDTDTGFVTFLKGVTLEELMGDNATNAIKDALTTQTSGETTSNRTLGDFLEINTENASGVLKKMAEINMATLLGNSKTTADPNKAIQGVIDGLTLSDVFGTYGEQTSAILKELYNMDNNGTAIAEGGDQGQMLVTNVFNNVTKVKLSTIFGDNEPKIFNLVTNYESLTIDTMDTMTFDTDNMTVGDLVTAGVINESDFEDGIKESVKNMKIKDIITNLNNVSD